MKLLLSIHQFDLQTFSWCMNWKRRQPVTQMSHWLSRTADGPLYVALIMALWFWHPLFDAQWLHAVVVAVLVERTLYFILKNSCRRHRPQEAIAGFQSFIRPSDQFSFPSGHTSGAFMFAVFLAELFPVLTAVVLLWAASIGGARVFLGVHFPTDTVMGALMGSSIASMALATLALGGTIA